MMYDGIKREARQSRYLLRAAKARKWAWLVRFAIIFAIGGALWQDDNLGAGMRANVYAAVERFEAATEGSKGGYIVQAALEKLKF